MRVIFISLNMLLFLPYFDMAIASENLTSDNFVDPTGLEKMTENSKDTEVENTIFEKKTRLVDSDLNVLSRNSTTDFDNTTESDDNEINNIHSSFNLAIIPAAAVFVFVIIICFKCCKWFRQYTRGDDKENNFYAVIVTDDDTEHVDITSDTASTVCYDTVSSNGSFLKRSGNENSFRSIKFWRHGHGSFKGDNGLSPNVQRLKKNTNSKQDLVQSTPLCDIKSKGNEPFADPDFRISSTSSAETISEQVNDSPTLKRNNRFRVSFVTETKRSAATAVANETRPTPNNNFKHENPLRSSLKKSSAKTISNETALIVPKDSPARGLDETVKMKDVGTQTNKSFRYSLRKSKGHVSDTDIDEKFFCGLGSGTLVLKSGDIQRKKLDKSGESINTLTKHTKHSSFSTPDERNISLSTVIPEISNFQFDTKVDVIQNNNNADESIVDIELDDDVFEDDLSNESPPCGEGKPNLKTSCESEKSESGENVTNEINISEYVSCSECNKQESREIIKTKRDTALSNVKDKEKSGITNKRLCKKCRADYEDIPAGDRENTERVRVQNLYKSNEVNSRHSSTLSLESSGYAELSSNESCSSSPVITHRV